MAETSQKDDYIARAAGGCHALFVELLEVLSAVRETSITPSWTIASSLTSGLSDSGSPPQRCVRQKYTPFTMLF
ncbi:hypothetical protein RRF57_005989 [Xylaria bambusicola]|uniref:Uncharacterized protein n=1 Tax=Xylaria bambusicola TaxID=326684 RepID=A0AAN7UYS1_9PEZI